MFIKYRTVRDHCHYTGKYRGAAHNICNLKYKTPQKITVVFHNGSTYDYHFIIKELAKEFEGLFECLGENLEKYLTFSVPIKKELDNGKKSTYKIKLIDSFRCMSSSLSNLVDNHSDGLHNIKCTDCKSYLEYISTKEEELLIFHCLKCSKNQKKHFNKELINKLANTYEEFSNEDINKFILLLRKGVYSYECMDTWERFDEKLLSKKGNFYSSLNMEDITHADYRHAKRVLKIFNNKNIGKYHKLYVQSDTLLLSDVFENLRDKCIEIHKLDPAHFLSASGLAWEACLKKKERRLKLLTDIDVVTHEKR